MIPKFSQNKAAPKVVKKLPEGRKGIKEHKTNNVPLKLNKFFSLL